MNKETSASNDVVWSGSNLRAQRVKNKLTQKELAKRTIELDPLKAGIHEQTIVKLEAGFGNPNCRSLNLLKVALNITNWLV